MMSALSSQIEYEPLERLWLDQINPRLTEDEQTAVTDHLTLLKLMDRQYDPLTIAESIAEHGYFASEPMIVLDEGDDKLTVLEGNRRLTALKGLADPEVSKHFKDPGRWAALREAAELPSEVPLLRAETRAASPRSSAIATSLALSPGSRSRRLVSSPRWSTRATS